ERQDACEGRTEDRGLVLGDGPETADHPDVLCPSDFHGRLARFQRRLRVMLPLSREVLEPGVLFLGLGRRLRVHIAAEERDAETEDCEFRHDALLMMLSLRNHWVLLGRGSGASCGGKMLLHPRLPGRLNLTSDGGGLFAVKEKSD